MDTWVDWILTHKLDSSIIAGVALFVGRIFWPQIKSGWSKVMGGKPATVVAVEQQIDCDEVGKYTVHLVQLRDMLSAAGRTEAVEAIDKVLIPAIFQARDTINKTTPAKADPPAA